MISGRREVRLLPRPRKASYGEAVERSAVLHTARSGFDSRTLHFRRRGRISAVGHAAIVFSSLLAWFVPAVQTATPPPQLVAALQRSGCYGACPVYSVRV